MLILDRYIFREFAAAFLAVIAFCALLLLVASIFERFGKMMEQETPLDKAVIYFLSSLPFNVMQTVPLASALAVMFSVGGLARNNEILAFLTSGIPALRLVLPIVTAGLLIFLLSAGVNEYVVPPLQAKARNYEQLYIEGRSAAKVNREKNVFARGTGNRFYLMRMYMIGEKRMVRPEIVDLTDDYSGVLQRVVAESAQLVERDKKANLSRWMFDSPRIWTFDETGKPTGFKQHLGQVPVILEEDLSDVLSQKKTPEEMNFAELRHHIRQMELRQQPTFALRTDQINKLTFPLGILFVMIVGFAYSIRSRAGTAMSAFGYGLGWAFAYYGLTATMQALGHAGTVSPLVSGTFTCIAFAGLAAFQLQKSARWHG